MTGMTVRNGFVSVNFSKGFMIVVGFSNNGKLKINKVSSKAKINSLYYHQNILEPIFEEEIPTLYRKDIGKVELDMDKASNHTSKSTAAYLAKTIRNRNKVYPI
ncbi:hypothetical protein TNCV_3290641 [Trichonephila clavipes]|nr:hypothetical protein TNCV_3290641 [Trichonephila clavipes]